MAKRSERHKRRVGKSGGFALHFRGAGVDQEKMDKIIFDYLRKKADLLGEDTSSADFNAQMAIEVIALGELFGAFSCLKKPNKIASRSETV